MSVSVSPLCILQIEASQTLERANWTGEKSGPRFKEHFRKQQVYSGGDWTVVIANGNRGVFVETNKADFNQLYKGSSE